MVEGVVVVRIRVVSPVGTILWMGILAVSSASLQLSNIQMSRQVNTSSYYTSVALVKECKAIVGALYSD